MTRRSQQHAGTRRLHMAGAVITVILLLSAITAGVCVSFGSLRRLWREQCRVTDRELDVVITSGKMVHPDIITLCFGLTNGANLATIPFAEKRRKLLDRTPNIRDIKIERRMPNRVTIEVIEREPAVRIAPPKGEADTGRVADYEGMVFQFSSNVSSLPVIREASRPGTPPGKRLDGMAAAALRLLETAAAPEFAPSSVLEVETGHPDYLLATLGDYSRAKIAWDHMLEDSRRARESLHRQYKRLVQAINARVITQPTLWIATDFGKPGRVYAKDPARSGGR